MSLLDQASRNVTAHKKMAAKSLVENNEEKFIIQPGVLMDILNDEVQKIVIDKKIKKQFSGYRTRLQTANWRLSGTLNFVNEGMFREQIGKTFEGMLKHIRLVQPNGEWVLMEYETDIRRDKGGNECLMLAANFVDAKNEEDMRYQNGIPQVDVKVDVSNANRDLIEAIKAQGQNSNDTELKDLMKQFIAAVAHNGISEQTKEPEVKEESVLENIPSDFSE